VISRISATKSNQCGDMRNDYKSTCREAFEPKLRQEKSLVDRGQQPGTSQIPSHLMCRYSEGIVQRYDRLICDDTYLYQPEGLEKLATDFAKQIFPIDSKWVST